MAHALRRISYATCDPNNAQFSFVAREPHGHCNFQYCHSFLGQSSEQVGKSKFTQKIFKNYQFNFLCLNIIANLLRILRVNAFAQHSGVVSMRT